MRTTVTAVLIGVVIIGGACTAKLSPEQQRLDAELKGDLERVRAEIALVKREDAALTGGLVKSLVRVRLEILQTTEALIDQRIHGVESGARTTVTVAVTNPDRARAADLAKQIESHKGELVKAQVEAAQSGGLVGAMAAANVAIQENTLAMLEQAYMVSNYGLAIPSVPIRDSDVTSEKVESGSTAPPPEATETKHPQDCLKISTFDSSVLSTNSVYVELAWKADVENSCDDVFPVHVVFTIYDKDEFELDSDDAEVIVPAQGTGKARGKMLVSPPEKARRMAKQGVHMSLR